MEGHKKVHRACPKQAFTIKDYICTKPMNLKSVKDKNATLHICR